MNDANPTADSRQDQDPSDEAIAALEHFGNCSSSHKLADALNMIGHLQLQCHHETQAILH